MKQHEKTLRQLRTELWTVRRQLADVERALRHRDAQLAHMSALFRQTQEQRAVNAEGAASLALALGVDP